MNTNLYMPTKVIMSQECILNNTQLLNKYGRRALIVTGLHSSKANGALEDITKALASLNIDYFIFDKVMANPTVACVYEGAAFAKDNKVDFVIGLGGGSPMDAAKAMALLAVQEIPEEELFLNQFGDEALPLIMIPTTAGTGSEVTSNSILSSDVLQTKRSISSPSLYPKLALLDAKYMKQLPMSITINTALDALSHAIEGMISLRSTVFSDFVAVESIKKIAACLKYLSLGKEQDITNLTVDIREKLLYGSMLAGIVISHTGTTAVHAMGYSLTYFKNIDHGRANALLLPSFLRFIAKSNGELVSKVLEPMGMRTIDEFEALFLGLIGEEEKITAKDLELFTEISSKAKSIPNSKVVPLKEDIYNLYARSLQILDS